MTPQAKLRLRLMSLVDDLMFETFPRGNASGGSQQFPGQTDWPKAKIRDLVIELEEIVEKAFGEIMTLEEMLSECNMIVTYDICTLCNIENDLTGNINANLAQEFPEEHNIFLKHSSLGPSHPYWKREKQLKESHETKCVRFMYDDFYCFICHAHMARICSTLEEK